MKYSFGPESLLQRVEIVRTEAGAKRAYLEAAPNADKTKLTSVREALAKHGYLTVPIEIGGKPYLEVRQFSSPESLLKQLSSLGAITGKVTTQAVPQDKIGVWQWIKNNTFKACLGMYVIGDIGYNIYAHYKSKFHNAHIDPYHLKERKALSLKDFAKGKSDKFDEFSGYGYTAGTFASAISTYLRGDQSDDEIDSVAKKIRTELKADGADKFSHTYAAINETESTSIAGRLKNGFIKFPAEILNACYGAAGFFMILANAHSSIPNAKSKIGQLEKDLLAVDRADTMKLELLQKQLKSNKNGMRVFKQDILLGSITLVSGLLASLIKEKPKTPDEPEPQGRIAKAWRWLQEKPLRIAAGGYLVSTSIHIGSTTQDYLRIAEDKKTASKMIKSGNSVYAELGQEKLMNAKREFGFTHGRMLFCVTNIIAEVLMALSSKGHGEGVKSDATVETSATAIAAENIALQAPEKREELVQKFSQHLADPKIMGGSAVIIERNLRANLKGLANNPWADTVRNQQTQTLHQAASVS